MVNMISSYIVKMINYINNNSGFFEFITGIFTIISIIYALLLSRMDAKSKKDNFSINVDYDSENIEITVINKSSLKTSLRLDSFYISESDFLITSHNRKIKKNYFFPLEDFQNCKFRNISERSSYLLNSISIKQIIEGCKESPYWKINMNNTLSENKDIKLIFVIRDFLGKYHYTSNKISCNSNFYRGLYLSFKEEFCDK